MRKTAFATLVCIVGIGVGSVVGQDANQPPLLDSAASSHPTTTPPIALGPPAPQTAPVLPNPATPAHAATKAKHNVGKDAQIILHFQIIEVGLADDVVLGTIEQANEVQFLTRASATKLVQQLVQEGEAKVLSSPRVVTLNGQAATVQVGQEVPIKRNGQQFENRQVGLRLQCRPEITQDRRLGVELKIEHSILGDGGAVFTRSVETAANMNWDQTLAVRGLGERLVLLVSPEPLLIRAHVLRTGQVVLGSARKNASVSDPPSLFDPGDFIGLYGGDVGEIEKIEVGQDHVCVIGTVYNQSDIPGIIAGLHRFSPCEVTSVSQHSSDDGIKLEITCRRPSVPPASADESLDTLEVALRKLFPSQSIELTILPAAVVLRGEVDPGVIDDVVAVAQQYYPNVISQLTSNATPKPIARQSNSSLSENLDGLTTELRALRAEVRNLIDVMKSE
ncbi:MAG: hypothetical protein AAFX06_21650 [Planctomycetota bacterium]